MKRAITDMLRRIRQHYCSHRFHIDDMKCAADEYVEARCLDCGKMERVPYGMAMPGKIEWGKRE